MRSVTLLSNSTWDVILKANACCACGLQTITSTGRKVGRALPHEEGFCRLGGRLSQKLARPLQAPVADRVSSAEGGDRIINKWRVARAGASTATAGERGEMRVGSGVAQQDENQSTAGAIFAFHLRLGAGAGAGSAALWGRQGGAERASRPCRAGVSLDALAIGGAACGRK